MACYIVFDGFHNNFQNNFISAPLQLAPLLSSKKCYKHPGAFREDTVCHICLYIVFFGEWEQKLLEIL